MSSPSKKENKNLQNSSNKSKNKSEQKNKSISQSSNDLLPFNLKKF